MKKDTAAVWPWTWGRHYKAPLVLRMKRHIWFDPEVLCFIPRTLSSFCSHFVFVLYLNVWRGIGLLCFLFNYLLVRGWLCEDLGSFAPKNCWLWLLATCDLLFREDWSIVETEDCSWHVYSGSMRYGGTATNILYQHLEGCTKCDLIYSKCHIKMMIVCPLYLYYTNDITKV